MFVLLDRRAVLEPLPDMHAAGLVKMREALEVVLIIWPIQIRDDLLAEEEVCPPVLVLLILRSKQADGDVLFFGRPYDRIRAIWDAREFLGQFYIHLHDTQFTIQAARRNLEDVEFAFFIIQGFLVYLFSCGCLCYRLPILLDGDDNAAFLDFIAHGLDPFISSSFGTKSASAPLLRQASGRAIARPALCFYPFVPRAAAIAASGTLPA